MLKDAAAIVGIGQTEFSKTLAGTEKSLAGDAVPVCGNHEPSEPSRLTTVQPSKPS